MMNRKKQKKKINTNEPQDDGHQVWDKSSDDNGNAEITNHLLEDQRENFSRLEREKEIFFSEVVELIKGGKILSRIQQDKDNIQYQDVLDVISQLRKKNIELQKERDEFKNRLLSLDEEKEKADQELVNRNNALEVAKQKVNLAEGQQKIIMTRLKQELVEEERMIRSIYSLQKQLDSLILKYDGLANSGIGKRLLILNSVYNKIKMRPLHENK